MNMGRTPFERRAFAFGANLLALYLPSWFALALFDGRPYSDDYLLPLPLSILSACLKPCLAWVPLEPSLLDAVQYLIVVILSGALLWWLASIVVRFRSRGAQVLVPMALALASLVLSPLVCWARAMSSIQC